MYFKIEADENGEYLRHDGKRFYIQTCRRVRPSTGWAPYDTQEDALAAWGLTYAPAEAQADT